MTHRLTATFDRLASAHEAAFMPFLVLGDPDLEGSIALAEALDRAGADILEFGFPFSDPPADGPVIQAADVRALTAGTTTERAFLAMAELRQRIGNRTPFVLLLYYNLILQHGIHRFFARSGALGVDAILIADLPIEEAGPAGVLQAAEEHSIAPIFIISERTTEARLDAILRIASGYLYLVTTPGVTGARESLDERLIETIQRLRARSPLPVLAGFGISKPEHVRRIIGAGADGVIVGSALIAQLAQHLNDRSAQIAAVEELARTLKNATRPH